MGLTICHFKYNSNQLLNSNQTKCHPGEYHIIEDCIHKCYEPYDGLGVIIQLYLEATVNKKIFVKKENKILTI